METDTEKAAEARTRILSQFERWLDSTLAEETPPDGLAANLLAALDGDESLPAIDGQGDLYSLWSAMTALTQEVKIQGRTFRHLNDTLTTKLASVLDSASVAAPAPSKTLEKNQLDLLLDLRDRLDRGLQSVGAAQRLNAPRPSLLSRWLGTGEAKLRQTRETLTALERGYALTLQRLDQALQDSHLYPISCEGKLFDPQRMTAVELEETNEVPEGTVVGIYRNGYEWNGEMYRAAEVKVARPLNTARTTGEKDSR
jgi:hypothetical protein